MKFISVRRLAAIFRLEFLQLNDVFILKLRSAIDAYFSENRILKAFGQSFTQNELIFILNQLEIENALIFHKWIEEDSTLVEYLCNNGELLTSEKEINLHADDQLFSAYQVFLQTYLAPILVEKVKKCIKTSELIALLKHLSFTPLLPEEKRIEIQKPVSSYLSQVLAQTKVSQERELLEKLKLIYSDEFVDVLNTLDKYFYKDVLTYVSSAKLIVQRNDLSPLILDKIKSSIVGLELNEEDYNNVLTFTSSKSFSLRSKKPQSKLNEMIKSPFFIVAVIVLLLNLVFYKCEG